MDIGVTKPFSELEPTTEQPPCYPIPSVVDELPHEFYILALNTLSTTGGEIALLRSELCKTHPNLVYEEKITHVEGVYMGTTENAYLVPITAIVSEHRILTIARKYNQECVLYVDRLRNATLKATNGENTPLGKWRETEKPLGHASFTFIRKLRKSYICSPHEL